MDERPPEPPHGLRLRSRATAAIDALESRGAISALQAFLLGPAHFEALNQAWHVEPMLFQTSKSRGSPTLEDLMARCTDIYAHLPTLYRLTVDGGRKRLLELGTRDGESTLALLMAAREIDGRLTSVDINPCPVATARVEKAGLREYWRFIEADDLALPWNQPIDHLFIDTSHRYEHTLAELRKYEPFVVADGVISMHDTRLDAVRRAIEEYFRARSDVRIFRYVHNNGLTVIEKGAPARS